MENNENINEPFKRKVWGREIHICDEIINNDARISRWKYPWDVWLVEINPKRKHGIDYEAIHKLDYETWMKFQRGIKDREREMQALNLILSAAKALLDAKDFCVKMYSKLRRNYGKDERI